MVKSYTDHGYNEGLKYPLFWIHPVDPHIKQESDQLLSQPILEARITDAFRDTLDLGEPLIRRKKKLDTVDFFIRTNELENPFQQLDDYYIKPAVVKIHRAVKKKSCSGWMISFILKKSGLQVLIHLYE